MRLLTIIDSLAVGGAERSLADLAPFLRDRGVEHHVGYLVERPGVGPELAAASVMLHPLTGSASRFARTARVKRLVQTVNPDLVHTTLFEADIAGRVGARLSGVPSVSSFVTEAYGPEHYGNPEYLRWKVRGAQTVDALTARLVARFHAVSSASAAVMAERLHVQRTKIDVVPRGRSEQRLGTRTPDRRARVRAELELEPGSHMILAAGRQYFMKGLDTLLSAMPSIVASTPTAVAVIAGRPGPATPDLENIVRKHGLGSRVRFLGYRADVPDLMTAADVFVLPSRAEGSPGALIEAMALEAPTVASDIPSVSELLGEDECAVLVPAESASALAEAIAHLLHDDERARNLAELGRARFLRRYTLEKVADRMMEFYKRSLG